MKKVGIYAGSFDPVTNGHLDIIERASHLFDQLYVVVMLNTSKNYTFNFTEKVQLLKTAVASLPVDNVLVESAQEKLVAQVAQELQAHWLVRGIRTAADFNYEISMQQINKLQKPDLETIYLVSSPQYMYLSSSMVKEVAQLNGKIDQLVPNNVAQALLAKLGERQ
ncbi:pantetheine-phosphate adenylyltransferase [Bombilactobacillus thymidiniphilus]|uniref:Phosphopantetheine adenylyltransferase n=1 Tax=Bombilactobacillus thymidiniphilus TaxID=2923363 RepID=A0ABY4PDA6_9LACO|nr:pantetheine-phosphate adenylyltransferase [Bombilactobacillus thymidiniphilus]UQS83758.1 pantetheine-phosphate adenylyltransferase [Bombilactobacillus thymidiniphilus]